MEAHLDAVYAYARAKLREEDLAREMAQRTFFKAFGKLGQLRDALAAHGWLLSTLRHEITMAFRAKAALNAMAEGRLIQKGGTV